MAKQVIFRRGTTAQHVDFVGANGEVTVDTVKHVTVVHDGVTAGGWPAANATAVNSALSELTANAANQAASIISLTANAATQANTLANLSANAASQQASIDAFILASNASAIFANIAEVQANVTAANANISILFGNATVQSEAIQLANANIIALQSGLVSTNANIANIVIGSTFVTQTQFTNNLTAVNTAITSLSTAAATTLDGLTDVVITTPSLNQVLKYDGTQWVNGTDATGSGGSSNSFETIAVAGQSNVVADSSTDTLTLVAGSGISITTNATTDTVTIINTASAGVTNFSALTDSTSASLTVDRIYLPAITRLDVTANGSSAYRFDQYGSVDDPTIYAISGTTIAFNLDGGLGSHPFLIQTSGGSNYNDGLMHVTSTGVVTTGSSAQGKTSGTLYWKIPYNTTGNYRYICANHPGMVGHNN